MDDFDRNGFLARSRSASMKPRRWVGFVVAGALGLMTQVASANGLPGTPFESGANAAAIEKLDQGATVMRTSAENTLTPEDRFRIRALGLPHTHAAAVVLHKIRRADGGRQLLRLHELVLSLDKFAPSDACDAIVATSASKGLCTGHVDGPIGNVPVRMPVSATLTEAEGGALHLVMTNHLAMEAKALFGWSQVVAPNHLKVAYDMFPTDDGWLVYVRVGVEMSNHEGSVKTISDALMKLESWLTRELAKS